MTQTFLSATQVDELVTLYQEGATAKDLAEHFGIHYHTVTAHLRSDAVRCQSGRGTPSRG